MDDIIEKVMTPLSNIDLMNTLNGIKIITYSNIHKYDNINQLLGKSKKVILLYQTSRNFGHWTCLYENKGQIYFFDSYGFIPDDTLKWTPCDLKKELKQDYRYLTRLLYESHKPVHYNEYRLQKKGDMINTCGRWCVIRLEYPDISVDDFHKIFTSFNLPPDILVSAIT